MENNDIYTVCVLLPQYASSVVKATAVTLPSGSSTPGRGRRQLPQTPLTPRPAVAYKTANSSAAPPPSSASSSQQTRFSRGLSEHERLLGGQDESPMPITRIGSDPNLNRQQRGGGGVVPEEAEDFQDTVSSRGGGGGRTAASSSTAASASAAPLTAGAAQGRSVAVPNGYHFTLGVNPPSGPGGRGTGSLREREDDDWC